MSVEIERCRPADREKLEALARAVFNAQFESYWSASGLENYLAEQFDPERIALDLAGDQARFYFVKAEGRIVGYGKLVLQRPIPVGEKDEGAELEKAYFLPEAIGRGLGAELIDHMCHDAEQAGAPMIWLDVLKTNDRAIAAYERRGFAIVGEIPFATDLMDIGFWVMRKNLGVGRGE